MGKYDPLRRLLDSRGQGTIELTFAEVDEVVGGLPASATDHRAWWGNSRRNPQAHAWLDAGRTVEMVDPARRRVRFSSRTSSGPPLPSHAPAADYAPQPSAAAPVPAAAPNPVTVDWAAVWRDVANALGEHFDAGRGHLLTEDVIRFAAIRVLQARGVDPARLRIEHRIPEIAAKFDLVIDAPPAAAVEFKYPRDPASQGAPDTMTHGELLRDLYRLAWLGLDDAWAVQVLDQRLRGYLARRSEVDWAWTPGDTVVLTPGRVRRAAPTALASLPEWTQHLTVHAQCEEAHTVGRLTVAAFRVTAPLIG